MDVDRRLLVLIMKIKIMIDLTKIELFFICQIKSSLSTSAFIFSTVSQILRTKFDEFWTQRCRNLKPIKSADFGNITCP